MELLLFLRLLTINYKSFDDLNVADDFNISSIVTKLTKLDVTN